MMVIWEVIKAIVVFFFAVGVNLLIVAWAATYLPWILIYIVLAALIAVDGWLIYKVIQM